MTYPKFNLKSTTVVCAIIPFLFSSQAIAISQQEHEVWDYIQARCYLISDYKLDVNIAQIEIETSDVEKVRNFANSLAQNSHSQLNQETTAFIKSMADTYKIAYREAQTTKRGKDYKTLESFQGRHRTVSAYNNNNATLTIFQPDQENKQVDIYPYELNYRQWNLVDIGIQETAYENPDHLESSRKEDGSISFSYLTKQQLGVTYDYRKEDYALQHALWTSKDGVFAEQWYIGHNLVNDILSPKVAIQCVKYGNRYRLEIILVNDLQIDPTISADELKIKDIPPWATVVDHRQYPPKVERLIEMPENILSDEVLLADVSTTKVSVPARKTAPNLTQDIKTDSLAKHSFTDTITSPNLPQNIKTNETTLLKHRPNTTPSRMTNMSNKTAILICLGLCCIFILIMLARHKTIR